VGGVEHLSLLSLPTLSTCHVLPLTAFSRRASPLQSLLRCSGVCAGHLPSIIINHLTHPAPPLPVPQGERPAIERLVAEEYVLDTVFYFEADRVECAKRLAGGELGWAGMGRAGLSWVHEVAREAGQGRAARAGHCLFTGVCFGWDLPN